MVDTSGYGTNRPSLREVMSWVLRGEVGLAIGVIGIDDEQRGQVPVAFVMVDPAAGLTEDDLQAWCRDNMASYKVPRVRFVAQLPMTATGKVKKHELAALLAPGA